MAVKKTTSTSRAAAKIANAIKAEPAELYQIHFQRPV